MKKALCVLLALSLAMGVAACTSPQPTNGGSGTPVDGTGSPDLGLLQAGKLQIGIEIAYPPLEYFADDGVTPTGFDVEMSKAICAALGLEPVFIDTAWDGIFAGLSTNKYDIVCSAVTMSAERANDMDFTVPYVENWQAIAIKVGNAPVTELAGLNGLKVGYQDATTSTEFLDELIATGQVKCETHPYEKVMQAFDDLRNGRIDCILTDSVVAAGYVHDEPETFATSWLQSAESDAVVETFGIAVKKGNQALVDALNSALAELQANGTLDSLKREFALIN
ncbi:MAG: ABC transporter substrate-binding protein [Eubacteriaceae bacterium]|jgi:polar amino acid transport system substrate-binding protein|nr:ABC transporter substrate-binding protein [Eubacteriaceae bacterium]